jgi:MFS family permease
MASGVAREITDPESSRVADRRSTATNEVLRDITRGGLAGLIVGVLLGGIGGRLVMRLAAHLVPDAVGRFTENGNAIGTITLGGSVALVVFVGLLFGAVAGSLWVVIGPWLPASPLARAVLAIPIAVALGTVGIVDDRNRDFAILGRDPLVIASLVVLVASFGPALVLTERWLERRLPRAGASDTKIVAGYALVTAIGILLTLLVVLPLFLGSELVVAGLSLVVVGVCTLASWWFFAVHEQRPPARLRVIGRAGVVLATAAGLVVSTREVMGALGVG